MANPTERRDSLQMLTGVRARSYEVPREYSAQGQSQFKHKQRHYQIQVHKQFEHGDTEGSSCCVHVRALTTISLPRNAFRGVLQLCAS
jgi:hypothetical protein